MKVTMVRPGNLLLTGLVCFSIAGCSWFTKSAARGYPTSHLVIGSSIDLDAYRASLPAFPQKNGHTRSRLAKGCVNCWTDVTIIASDTARFFGPGHPPHAGDSVAVAFLKNVGDSETVMYDLKPSTVATYVVYVVNDSGNIKWILVEVPASATGALSVRHRGGIHGCSHSPRAKSEADFRNCDYETSNKEIFRLASETGAGPMTARFMKNVAMRIAEDPGWVGCTDGCCTLQLD